MNAFQKTNPRVPENLEKRQKTKNRKADSMSKHFLFRFFLFCVLWDSGVSSSVFAQRDATVPDPDPEIERKALQVADGFEVNLFAADPLLASRYRLILTPQVAYG